MPEETNIMNETMVVRDNHFTSLETISAINRVEGFDPASVTKEVLSENGEKGHFLPLIWKKAWARMVYPLHRCHAKITEIKDGVVAAYAAFYVDNDPVKEATGEGFAFITIDMYAPDPAKARNDAISLAIGSAKSRAYTDAGFGYQFFTDDCIDDLQKAAESRPGSCMTAASVPGESSGVIPSGQKDGSLASMVLLAPSVPEEDSTEQQETPQTKRKSQYEIAKAENEELTELAVQLANTVECMEGATAGSAEHSAAEKTLEGIREKWIRLSTDIERKMQKPSVQEAKSADSGYAFFSKTYEQVLQEAESALREKTAAKETYTGENSGPLPENETAGTENCTGTDAVQMVLDGTCMTEKEAMAVVSTCCAYSGKTIGELYADRATRALLPKLFERTDEPDEKRAIRTVIESDAELMAYCKRNDKDLSIA